MMIDPDPAAEFATFLAEKYDFGPEYGMVLRRSDVGIAKKRIRWLPTREYLMVSGSFAAMRLAQEPFKDVRVRRAGAMADNWHEVLDSNPWSHGKGAPDPRIPAALKERSTPLEKRPPEGRQ